MSATFMRIDDSQSGDMTLIARDTSFQISDRPPCGAERVRPRVQPLDLIFIEGLAGQSVIGIHASELHDPQPLVIDVFAGVPRARACDTDHIADTIDYSVVRERLLRLLAEHRLQLLEAFAEAVADILLDEFHAQWVRVKIVKPRKFDDVAAVGVLIERERRHDERAVQSLWRGAPELQLIGAGMVPGKT